MNIAGHFSSLTAAVLPAPADPERRPHVTALFNEYERQVYTRTNQFFIWLLALQWVFALVLSVVWSPRTWAGPQSSVNPHLLAAVFLGGMLCVPPIWLMRQMPFDLLTRQVVAVAQVGFSALLIDLTGGRIETHFHVFGSLAFLALYRDWRVLPTATVVVALDHLLRGIWFPESVYGVPFATIWRTGEHASWVIFEDVVLVWACLVSRREMWEICLRHDQNESLLDQLEQKVCDRTKELETVHQRLVTASRQAGQADVATGVLHNVGNVLTSVNLIIHDVQDRLRSTRLSHLRLLIGAMQKERHRLAEYLTVDPVGRTLPDFLGRLDSHLTGETERLRADVEILVSHFEHIREIILAQQNSARQYGVTENLLAARLVDEALQLNAASFDRHGIILVKELAVTPRVRADRHKVMQILVNLLKNAKDSVLTADLPGRKITLRVADAADQKIAIIVEDNGAGIAQENMVRIFQHGFTTKKDGHGFGLHSCALAAREMAGDLTAASPGLGRGATFTLILPEAP